MFPNFEFFQKNFLLETIEKAIMYVPKTISGGFSDFQVDILRKGLDPGSANKKSIIWKFFKKTFFTQNNQKSLKVRLEHHLGGSFGEFYADILKIWTWCSGVKV